MGLEKADDAGVYKISQDLALIQTVDFFTPIVDDPYWFGKIAAANALSDIYAMGGIPKTAMNLVGFPAKDMDISILRQIILGGLDTLKEASVILVGGHSVEDKELKYGLSITGLIHPDRVLTKQSVLPSDMLILTKPIGTGVINTAIKAGLASEEVIKTVTSLMASLNKKASEIMSHYPVHACTDITGFGLLGHMAEMINGSPSGLHVISKNIPFINNVMEYGSMGLFPAGAYKNREFFEHFVIFEPHVDPIMQDLLFDPQTSGGLLISVEKNAAEELLASLKEENIMGASIIGQVTEEHGGKILVS